MPLVTSRVAMVALRVLKSAWMAVEAVAMGVTSHRCSVHGEREAAWQLGRILVAAQATPRAAGRADERVEQMHGP